MNSCLIDVECYPNTYSLFIAYIYHIHDFPPQVFSQLYSINFEVHVDIWYTELSEQEDYIHHRSLLEECRVECQNQHLLGLEMDS